MIGSVICSFHNIVVFARPHQRLTLNITVNLWFTSGSRALCTALCKCGRTFTQGHEPHDPWFTASPGEQSERSEDCETEIL